MRPAHKLVALPAFVLLWTAAFAPLQQAGAEADASCQPQYVRHLGPACLLANGLYQVFLEDGTTLTTHGPDPTPPDGEVGFGKDADQRQPVCADEWRMHVLYGHPSSIPSRYEQVVQDLRDAVRRTNALLNADALASGKVEADYKVACDGSGDIRIDAFQGPDTGGNAYTTDFSAIVSAARLGHAGRLLTVEVLA